jgi:hypothetical protein
MIRKLLRLLAGLLLAAGAGCLIASLAVDHHGGVIALTGVSLLAIGVGLLTL